MPDSQPGHGPAADVSVRPARPGDAEPVTAVQLAAWRAAYAELLPHGLLDGARPEELVEHWRASVAEPPSAHHAVLVAVEAGEVVGYAVLGPAAPPATDGAGEVVDLVVGPQHQRRGHASRLLSASVEHLRAHGDTEVLAWCDEDDDARRGFLESAGLVEDGTVRTLELGAGAPVVHQHRWSAAL